MDAACHRHRVLLRCNLFSLTTTQLALAYAVERVEIPLHTLATPLPVQSAGTPGTLARLLTTHARTSLHHARTKLRAHTAVRDSTAAYPVFDRATIPAACNLLRGRAGTCCEEGRERHLLRVLYYGKRGTWLPALKILPWAARIKRTLRADAMATDAGLR